MGEGRIMHTVSLVEALKRALKSRGITYAALAAKLGLSEASVKRMFSRRDFTLQRMDDVCYGRRRRLRRDRPAT